KEVSPANPASLQVFNGISNGPSLYKVLSHNRPFQFRTPDSIKNNQFNLLVSAFSISSPPQDIMFYSTTDTLPKDEPLLKSSLNLEKGAMYSMFLYGPRSAPAYLLQKDEIPRLNAGDSVAVIRFANLSEEQGFSVNLKGNASGSLFQEVEQYSVTRFVSLPLIKPLPFYELEIRDAVSGDLLLTYQMLHVVQGIPHSWLRIPCTFVLTGQRGGTGAAALKLVNMNHR
ncbi:MAG: hypothetical protein ACTHMC_20955, partial [Pseudobacter sp.]|uniref:hypothetical protein n=1 Tax=Pseudobacter sp. TaxID=2045420 RepID=UPI003F811EB7